MPHVTTITVRFADLDPYNHVNHARYLTYFESARIEMLDEMGFGMDQMQRQGHQIVLVDLTARFHASATLHDRLVITTSVGEVRRVSSRWSQEARRGDEPVASIAVTAAFTDPEGRPTRVPDGFVESARRFV